MAGDPAWEDSDYLQDSAHCSGRTRREDRGDAQEAEYQYWQHQVDEHQKQLQAHQKRWHMQRQEWPEEFPPSALPQQSRHRSMRRKSSNKPERPSWTCLEKLRKTLTIDSAEENEVGGPTNQAAIQHAPQPEELQLPEEEDELDSKQRHIGRHHLNRHPKHRSRPDGKRGHQRVRWSGLQTELEEQRLQEPEQLEAEEEQLAEGGGSFPRVASPRFGRPESSGSLDSPYQRSPIFGGRVASSTELRKETINYIQPWNDGVDSFPASSSTVATAMDSPGRGPRSREHHLQAYKQQQTAVSHEHQSWAEEEEAGQGHQPSRRPWAPDVPAGYPHSTASRMEADGRQINWRNELRHQLDEGLREALAHDLLEFQKEAFFGFKGKKAKPELKLLEEGVEYREDSPEAAAEEEQTEADEAVDAAEGEVDEQQNETATGGCEETENEVEKIAVSSPGRGEEDREEAVDLAAKSPEAIEEDANDSSQDAEGTEPEEEQEQTREEDLDSEDSEDLAAELQTSANPEESPAEEEFEGEVLEVEEEEELLEAPAQEEAADADNEVLAEAAVEQTEMPEEDQDGHPADADGAVETAEEDTPEPTDKAIEEEASSVSADPRTSPQPPPPRGMAVTDQLTLEALRALSLGMLHQQPQLASDWHMGATTIPGEWVLGGRAVLGGEMPTPAGFTPQQPQLRTGTDMLYSWIAGTARLQQQLLMQSSGLLVPTPPAAEVRDEAASPSTVVPPDFKWWAPAAEEAPSNSSNCEQKEEETIEAAKEEEAEQTDQTPSVASPKTPQMKDEEAAEAATDGGAAEAATDAEAAEAAADVRAPEAATDGEAAEAATDAEATEAATDAEATEAAADAEAAEAATDAEAAEAATDGEAAGAATDACTQEAVQPSPKILTPEAKPESEAAASSPPQEEAAESPPKEEQAEAPVADAAAAEETVKALMDRETPEEAAQSAPQAPEQTDGLPRESAQSDHGVCTRDSPSEEKENDAAQAWPAGQRLSDEADIQQPANEAPKPEEMQEGTSAEVLPPKPHVATVESCTSPLLSLTPRELNHFERLQELRFERAAAKQASLAAKRKIPLTSPIPCSGARANGPRGELAKYEQEAPVTPREALPAPPPARVRDSQGYLAAKSASFGLEDVQNQRPPGLQLARSAAPEQADHLAARNLQQKPQEALSQQLREEQLQQQKQQALQLQRGHLGRSQSARLQRTLPPQLLDEQQREAIKPGTTWRTASRVRFSDEAVKNEELKEQLRKQAKELQKLRHFRDQQHALHQETERHLDTLHSELQSLAKENVCLLHEQKQMSLGAQKTAFQLLRLHALQQQKEAERRDAAVSPRNEQEASLEHFLSQNKELEQMQWQLQQLRRSVVVSQAGQQREKQRLLELQQREGLLQQENLDLKKTIEAMRRSQAELHESQLKSDDEKQQTNAELAAQQEGLKAEQRARVEAEEQLEETLEVMQLLKQCLKEQKEQVACLEQQLEAMKQEHEQLVAQQHRLAANAQSAALLDVLAAEAAVEGAQADQQADGSLRRAGDGSANTLDVSSPPRKPVETTEAAVQAGNPMPYVRSVPKAEQQQQATRQAAQQQQLIARLKTALSTQAKAFSKDKAYYQQLVIQLQNRIAELERYQHQLLLHIQQQQQQHALHAHSGQAAVPYRPLVFQAPLPFDPTQAAAAAAAAALQLPSSAAAVQTAAREASNMLPERSTTAKGGGERSEAASVESAAPQEKADTADWLKLLVDVMEENNQEERASAAQQTQQADLTMSSDSEVTSATPVYLTAVTESTLSDPASASDPRAVGPSGLGGEEGATAQQQQASSSQGAEGSSTPQLITAFPDQMQQLLLKQLQEKLGAKMNEHLEKLQQTLSSPRPPTMESAADRFAEPMPALDLARETGASRQFHGYTSGTAHRERDEARSFGTATGLQQALAQQQHQSAEQRLSLLLQQHRQTPSAASSPAYTSPVGTVESVHLAAADPPELELKPALGKRNIDLHRSPVTSTTASSVVADFSTEECCNTGNCFPQPESVATKEEAGEDVPQARREVQQFRRLLRQQGLLS
ncbi:hypothetical protein Efla_005816 [Eimeria flavescens]